MTTLFSADWLAKRIIQHNADEAEKAAAAREEAHREMRWIVGGIIIILVAAVAIGAIALGGGL